MDKMSICLTFLLVLLAQCFMVALAMSLTTDKSALVEFKTRITSDPHAIISSNWSSATSICSWVGVSCGALHRRVTTLYLPNMNLSGSLPPHLGYLSFLAYFNLSGNSFQGQLPPELGKLRRLKLIDLSYNILEGSIPLTIYGISSLQVLNLMSNYNLTGTISRNIGNLTQLKEIYIANTDMTGEIPHEMGNLHNLEILKANNASFSGPIPPSIFNISSLRWIYLQRNNLLGTLPDDLCENLPNLEVLFLYINQLNGSIPPSIGKCRKLQYMSLDTNRFTGYIPRSIGNLTGLIEIYLTDNDFEGEVLWEVGYLNNLEILTAANAGFSGFIPPNIFNISSLRRIFLGENNLLGALPNDLCDHLPKLEVLSLYKNQLNGSIPSSIGKCRKLQNLTLYTNRFTGYIPRSIGNLTQLTKLSLRNNDLKGEIPSEVGNLPLKYLYMDDNFFIGSIPPMIFNISTLEIISLVSSNLSGQLPSTLGLGLPKLTGLYLDYNKLSGRLPNSISNASLLSELDLSYNSFFGLLPNTLGDLRFLEWLNLGVNNMFADFATPQTNFLSSLTNCRFLRHLVLSSTPFNGILPDSIGNLSSSLQYLYLSNCSLQGSIPLGIGNLSNLVLLSLSKNNLSGPIPAKIGRLQKLQGLYLGSNILEGAFSNALCQLKTLDVLSLYDNQLNGSIPECISNFTSLSILHLESNKFNSIIPSTFWSLTYILYVNFASNGFSGSLPLDVGKLRVLTSLDLSRNQLSGNLPRTISDLKNLIYLSLAENELEGSIPQSVGGLVSLESLDLSKNSLSGAIPRSLEALSSLKILNVSFNKLEGEIPAGGSFWNFSAESFVGNTMLCGLPRFHVPMCKSTLSRPLKVVGLLKYVLPPIVAVMILLVLALFIIFRRKQKSELKATEEEGFTGPAEWRRISYLELQHATDKFNESHLLGTGSFGSVYNGTLPKGMNVAVKVFNLQVEGALGSFDTECEVLRNVRHRNLIKIISNCSNEDFKALVLEFMPNGTLEKWLHSGEHCLNILQRLNIMTDVAFALEYLHHGYSIPIIHCDLKPSNVLLDEDMVAHVGDFGLTKLLGEGDSVTQTMRIATIGYMAPERGSLGIVSTKCDVYSFGILLMETFTKRKPTDELFDGEMSLKLWVQDSLPGSVTRVMDVSLVEERRLIAITNCVSSVLKLALDCCAEQSKERKNMKDAAAILNKIKNMYLNDTRRIR